MLRQRHALGVGASGDRAPADHAVTVSRVDQIANERFEVE